jgi:hypothetical protein
MNLERGQATLPNLHFPQLDSYLDAHSFSYPAVTCFRIPCESRISPAPLPYPFFYLRIFAEGQKRTVHLPPQHKQETFAAIWNQSTHHPKINKESVEQRHPN